MSESFGDPLSEPFWDAARRHELVIQRCRECSHHQFYPRPVCLRCESVVLDWVVVAGEGTVYSMTTVHLSVMAGLSPPYVVGLVQLDEGPRLVANFVNGEPSIGDRVVVTWRDRGDLPPLPVFEPRSARAD